MSALYNHPKERENKKQAALKKKKNDREAIFTPYTSTSDPERKSYYQDLQRQYSDLQSQLNDMNPSGFGNWVTGNNERIKAARRDIETQMSNIQGLLTKSKSAFGALDQQKAPELSPQMLARLEALEQESKAGPLVSDPLFQGDRATIVRGGARALAGLGSAQKISRFGTGGAGSVQDAYDRLGGQLAQLGQQSRAVKEQKRDIVAETYQAFDDSVRDFENASANAEAAIINGNMDAAARFIEAASQAEQRMRQAQAQVKQSVMGNLLGSAAEVGAMYLGAPSSSGSKGLGTPTAIGTKGGAPATRFSSGAVLPGTPTDLFAPTAPVGRANLGRGN